MTSLGLSVRDEQAAWEPFRIGDRVVLRGGIWRGEHGRVESSGGPCGHMVSLDNGPITGIAHEHISEES